MKGEVICGHNSAGLHMEDAGKIALVIAVSGGRGKAEAILSVLRHFKQQVLVTDEAAAREILVLMGRRHDH
ncbi:MAG: sugar-binding domain-containing protein [Bacillota bacterium]